MPTKKTEELRAMSVEELETELAESHATVQQLRFDNAINGLPNPMMMKNIKKDIARINTELRAREIAAMTPEQLQERSKIRNRRKK